MSDLTELEKAWFQPIPYLSTNDINGIVYRENLTEDEIHELRNADDNNEK